MKNALIGFSGFVGSTLMKQRSFDALYRSTNIHEIDGAEFDIVVCAGASAQKWVANRDPQADLQKIYSLIAHLKTIRCKTFVLISSVDVFSAPVHVDEDTVVVESGLHPYGLHRRYLEKFAETTFPNHLIVRLPGLVGPGLRKNVIFDLLNKNNLTQIESRSVFQFYPMVNLWYDVQTAVGANLGVIHLTSAPISVAEVSLRGFGEEFTRVLTGTPASYDVRTRHAALFGAEGPYQYSAQESVQAIRAYAQSEPTSLKAEPDDAS